MEFLLQPESRRLELIEPNLRELADQLLNVDINFTYEFDESIHDRHIKTDTGWNIVSGRGLDIFRRWDRGFISVGRSHVCPEVISNYYGFIGLYR
jgi:hypothetical protein